MVAIVSIAPVLSEYRQIAEEVRKQRETSPHLSRIRKALARSVRGLVVLSERYEIKELRKVKGETREILASGHERCKQRLEQVENLEGVEVTYALKGEEATVTYLGKDHGTLTTSDADFKWKVEEGMLELSAREWTLLLKEETNTLIFNLFSGKELVLKVEVLAIHDASQGEPPVRVRTWFFDAPPIATELRKDGNLLSWESSANLGEHRFEMCVEGLEMEENERDWLKKLDTIDFFTSLVGLAVDQVSPGDVEVECRPLDEGGSSDGDPPLTFYVYLPGRTLEQVGEVEEAYYEEFVRNVEGLEGKARPLKGAVFFFGD